MSRGKNEVKVCNKCKRTLAIRCFHKSGTYKGVSYLRNVCKSCMKALNSTKERKLQKRRERVSNRETNLERVRELSADGKYKNTQKASSQKWKAKNRKKLSETKKVNYLIRKGDIERLPCRVCGVEEDIQAKVIDFDKRIIHFYCRKHNCRLRRYNNYLKEKKL